MARTCYQTKNFRAEARQDIERANDIIVNYRLQGFDLTLRQLYYQFVARTWIPNNLKSYKRLGELVSDARLAGLIDWDAISDRTRQLRGVSHWRDPAGIIGACVRSYAIDKWVDQPMRIEVWVEKDALAGIFEAVCDELDVPWFACRGYVSQSEMHAAGLRLAAYRTGRKRQKPIVLHFGDHDPSGEDMTRDIATRLKLFGGPVEVRRVALTPDQVEEHDLPPNPAKMTDARAAGYVERHGSDSWELDALAPPVLTGLVRDAVLAERDDMLWATALEAQEEDRRRLTIVQSRWEELTGGL